MNNIRTESNRDPALPLGTSPDETVSPRKRPRSFRETLKRKLDNEPRESEISGLPDERHFQGNSGSRWMGTNTPDVPARSQSAISSVQTIGRVIALLEELTRTRMKSGTEYIAVFGCPSAGRNGVTGRIIIKDRILRIELGVEDLLFMDKLSTRIPELRTRYGLTDIRMVLVPPSDAVSSADDVPIENDGSAHEHY